MNREGSKGDMTENIIYFLKRVPFFKEIGDKELEELSKLLRYKKYNKDAILFDEGDPGDKLYLIIEGKVQIYRQSYSNYDRDPVILAILKNGDYFGEMAILQPDQYRSAYAKILEQSSIYTLLKSDFDQFLERYPKVSLSLLNVALNRLRKANRVIEDALRLDSRSRVIKHIIYLAEEHGVKKRRRNGHQPKTDSGTNCIYGWGRQRRSK